MFLWFWHWQINWELENEAGPSQTPLWQWKNAHGNGNDMCTWTSTTRRQPANKAGATTQSSGMTNNDPQVHK